MNISPDEAVEALADIQNITQRTRRSIASSGTHIFLIITGLVWLVGFLATQFLSGLAVVIIWVGMSLIGSGLAALLGSRTGKHIRSASTATYARRIIIFWLLLILFAAAAITVARPEDGKQNTMLIIIFIMIGQLATGLLLSFSATWWAVPLTALALAGYYLVPAYFYLWMAILVGGGMIGLGLYIRLRW